MNTNLKNYQEKAVGELITTFKTLLTKEDQKKVCVFQAPAGSGKTLMTAKFIEEIIKELPETDLCFVWVSIGKGELHLQSKHSLEQVFGGAPRVSLVEEEFTGGRERIVRNEVVVVNWEKLRSKERDTGDWKNVLMKDGEKLNFRDVLSKTREQRNVIMIIDESHIGATAERTNELRDEINADVILEMSATPKIKPDPRDLARGTAGYVFVEPKDVIDEGMIKKELIINEKIDEITDDEADSQEVVLEVAYKKRLELKRLFEKEKTNINPLVLVQIPNADAGDDKIKAIKHFLEKKDINEKNNKLRFWLKETDESLKNRDEIAEPDSGIEFLIFKQAIDTGWDCPRAHILVKFRESHSETFEIQTVGRILRMPEQKHYDNEALNRGYIYTNVQSILVKKEDYNPNIIKHLKAKRIDSYEPIEFMSYYKSRVDYGDVTSSFTSVFESVANKYFKVEKNFTLVSENIEKVEAKGITLNLKLFQQEIIVDTKLEGKSFDELEGKVSGEAFAKLSIAGNDLQVMFEQAIKDNLRSFRNVKRSVAPVKTALYNWFKKYLGSKQWPEEIMLIQKTFLHGSNRAILEAILADSIETYRLVKEKEVQRKVQESEQIYQYELPAELFYNEHTDEKLDYDNYAFTPLYLPVDRSEPEKRFEELLNSKSDKITWWWKNGENKRDFFGIKYEYEGKIFTFYPDYLVQLEDVRLGILETKDVGDRDGKTYTKAKAEALQHFINTNSRKGLFGGIAIQRNGRWHINSQSIYDWSKNEHGSWDDWEDLVL